VQEMIELAGVEVLALEPNTLDSAISWYLDEYLKQVEAGSVENDYEVLRDAYNATKK